jgi:DNA-binding phage protein
MATTRDFGEWLQDYARKRPDFAEALLQEGIDALLDGEVDVGRSLLRDYIKGTIGFEKLGEAIGVQPKSLIRMFGPRGNPQAKNIFSVIGYLRKHAGHVKKAA